jgi:hypothetical protein
MSKAHNDPEYRKNRTVILREQPTCTVCNKAKSTQVDHIIPLDAGGGHNPENLRGICAKCNNILGHKYVTQRNETRNTIRADALKDNGIQIQNTKQKRFFTEKNLITPTQLRIIPDDPNQPGLAVTGRDQPRLETMLPEHAGSYVDGVREFAREYLDVELMAWQLRVLEGQLLYDSSGDLCNRVSLVSTARQNGKTVALMALVGWWLTEMPKISGLKQTVLSTAHRLDLAVMLFDNLAPILEKRFNATLMRSYGRNSVTMRDGSKWFLRAANHSVGHGMSCDLIVADEMWDISREVIDGGLLPAQRAKPNPLLSLWSTAGTEASTAMLKWREQGLRAIDTKQNSSFYFAEWSPPPELSPLDNPEAWAYANPALGKTLTLKTIVAESENPDRASFLRASCNLWVASDKAWIQPGIWSELHYLDTMPDGGTVAIESSLDDSRYFAVRCVVLPDRRTVATVEFVVDTYDEMILRAQELAKNPNIKFAITPTIDLHWLPALERRKIVVGYGEILKFTPRVRAMIGEKLLWHTGEEMFAEHVQRAVAVRSQNSIALSSQRSPGPIELARCMVWAAALTSKPTSSGKPMIVVGSR